MNKQFLFFNMTYEQVKHIPGALYRILFIPIGYVGMHWHKEMELILVLRGNVSIQNSRISCLAEKGDLFWVNGSEMHGLLEGNRDNLLLVLQIDPVVLQNLTGEPFGDHYRLDPRSPLPEPAATHVKKSMAEIMKLTGAQSPGYSWFCTAHLFNILGTIHNGADLPDHEDRPRAGGRGQTAIRVKKIIDYLNTRYRQPLTLDELAGHFNLSTFYISHYIQENTGFSFQEHLNFLRLNHAVDLMMNTDLRLIDISLESGFSDPKYMNLYFRKIFGLSPREMRRKENWRELVRNRFGQGDTDWESYGSWLEPYLEP